MGNRFANELWSALTEAFHDSGFEVSPLRPDWVKVKVNRYNYAIQGDIRRGDVTVELDYSK